MLLETCQGPQLPPKVKIFSLIFYIQQDRTWKSFLLFWTSTSAMSTFEKVPFQLQFAAFSGVQWAATYRGPLLIRHTAIISKWEGIPGSALKRKVFHFRSAWWKEETRGENQIRATQLCWGCKQGKRKKQRITDELVAAGHCCWRKGSPSRSSRCHCRQASLERPKGCCCSLRRCQRLWRVLP